MQRMIQPIIGIPTLIRIQSIITIIGNVAIGSSMIITPGYTIVASDTNGTINLFCFMCSHKISTHRIFYFFP